MHSSILTADQARVTSIDGGCERAALCRGAFLEQLGQRLEVDHRLRYRSTRIVHKRIAVVWCLLFMCLLRGYMDNKKYLVAITRLY